MITERAESRPPVIEVYRAIIINGAGEFLLGQRSANDRWNPLDWELFGGKREPGQTPIAALVGEIVQETGMTVVPGRLIYEEETVLIEGPRAGRTYKLQVRTATVVGGTLVLSKEHNDAGWFTIEEALSMDLTTQTRSALNAWKETRNFSSQNSE